MPKLSPYEHTVRAIIYASSPEKRRRVLAEAEMQPPISRFAMKSFYTLIYRRPDLFKAALDMPYRVRGIDVIAYGRNSTVIRNGATVLKLARASERMSKSARQDLVAELRRRHAVARQYLGGFCIDQEFTEVAHPLSGKPIVAAEQPHITFQPYRRGIEVTAAQAAQLADFGERSALMDAETGLVSDVSGKDNFGFEPDAGSLVMVDTIALQGADGGQSVAMARDIIKQLAVSS